MSHQVCTDQVVVKRPRTPLFLTAHGNDLSYEVFSPHVLLLKRDDAENRLRRRGIEMVDVELCDATVTISTTK